MHPTNSTRVSKKRFCVALSNYFDKIVWDAVICAANTFTDSEHMDPISNKIKSIFLSRIIENIENHYKPGDNLTGYLAIISEIFKNNLNADEISVSFLTNLIGHVFLQVDYFLQQRSGIDVIVEIEKTVNDAILITYFEKILGKTIQGILNKSNNFELRNQKDFLDELNDLFKKNLLQTASVSDLDEYITSSLSQMGINSIIIGTVKAVVASFIYEVIKQHDSQEFFQKLETAIDTAFDFHTSTHINDIIESIMKNWLNNSIIFEISEMKKKKEHEEFYNNVADSLYKMSDLRISGDLSQDDYVNAVNSVSMLITKVKGINDPEFSEFINNLKIAVNFIHNKIHSESLDVLSQLLEIKDLGAVSLLV